MELQQDYPAIRETGAELLAVSGDGPDGATLVVRKLGLDYPVLYDENAAVIRSYGVKDPDGEYAVPSVFIIDTDGAVRHRFAGTTSERTENRAIIEKLKELAQGKR